jgi:hypothetical protein
MAQLADVSGYCLLAWLASLAAILAFRMLTGEIPLGGILTTGGDGINPERLQSLLVTCFVVIFLIVEIPGAFARRSLPDIPQALLVLLGGSNGLYLGGKIARTQRAASTQKQRGKQTGSRSATAAVKRRAPRKPS